VLWNFLGTYASRYSDYDGYWLFGFLVPDLGELRVDLLERAASDPNTPLELAVQSAAAKFDEQCQKARLAQSQIREAWLAITRLPGFVRGPVNGHTCDGHSLRFAVRAVTDLGRCYEKEQVVFVAPHNAKLERRSTRASESKAAPDYAG